MFLERIEIAGFRGINRLSLMLEYNNVLIGENAWGKSSLLDALTLLLAADSHLYEFTASDFYFPPGEKQGRKRHLHIILTFRESSAGSRHRHRVQGLAPLWVKDDNNVQRIHYRLEGDLGEDGAVLTQRSFLDENGHPLMLKDIEGFAKKMIRLTPVLRLRDARFMQRLKPDAVPAMPETEITARQLDFLTRELVAHPQNLSDQQIRKGLSAMVELLEHYFSEQGAQTTSRLSGSSRHDLPGGWRYLEVINQMIERSSSRAYRMILLNIFATLLRAKGNIELDPDAKPLLLIEDPETRLHPIMLSVAWNLLNLLPLQKITTTNSGELLSLTPAEHVCRLIRESAKVTARRLGPDGISAEERRRIAFHIRFNRASSLFARCWLLVEGETEVWMMNELARQCGYNFSAEGVRVIEFAQSGLRPLIKFARKMGIEWHVLVDGDEAGKKYADIARSLTQNDPQQVRDHLTALPAPDMEHYMYRQGFAEVFYRVAQLPPGVSMNTRRIITKAIRRSSKPDLAIEIAMEAAQRGEHAIPPLLKRMFSRVIWLSRGRAD